MKSTGHGIAPWDHVSIAEEMVSALQGVMGIPLQASLPSNGECGLHRLMMRVLDDESPSALDLH